MENVLSLAHSAEAASVAVMNIHRRPDLTHLTVAIAELLRTADT
jgi:hypothetical protein